MKKDAMRRKNNIRGYMFILPALAGFLLFWMFPMIYGLIISFTDYGGLSTSLDFVGLKNYIALFRDDYFMVSLKNNLIYAAVFTPVTLGLSLTLAIGLHKCLHFSSMYRMAMFLPYITSMVSIAIIWKLLLNPTVGPVNAFLENIGIHNPPQWLTSSKWALLAVIFVSVWKTYGYYMIILLAGLQNIPTQYYEAAAIDGAKGVQMFKNITLPCLSPTVFLCLIMLLINSFQVFDLVSIMTEGGPGRSTNVLVYRIYQEGFVNLKMGYASAMSMVLFLIIMLVTYIQFLGQKRWVNYQ